jgi:hypothetical protein
MNVWLFRPGWFVPTAYPALFLPPTAPPAVVLSSHRSFGGLKRAPTKLRWDRDFETFGKNKRVGPNAIDPLAGEGVYWGDRGPEQIDPRPKRVRFHDFKPSPARLFVANIAWSVSNEMLKEHMESCGGQVQNVIIQYSEQGKHLGFGLVEYATPAQADQAVQRLHQTVLHQRALVVRKDQHQGVHTFRGEMVRVEHIPVDIPWEAYKAHMTQYGGHALQSCQYFNTYRGDEKYGNLFFKTEQDAKQAAVLLNGTLLRGKKITASYVSRERREEVLQRGYQV